MSNIVWQTCNVCGGQQAGIPGFGTLPCLDCTRQARSGLIMLVQRKAEMVKEIEALEAENDRLQQEITTLKNHNARLLEVVEAVADEACWRHLDQCGWFWIWEWVKQPDPVAFAQAALKECTP